MNLHLGNMHDNLDAANARAHTAMANLANAMKNADVPGNEAILAQARKEFMAANTALADAQREAGLIAGSSNQSATVALPDWRTTQGSATRRHTRGRKGSGKKSRRA